MANCHKSMDAVDGAIMFLGNAEWVMIIIEPPRTGMVKYLEDEEFITSLAYPRTMLWLLGKNGSLFHSRFDYFLDLLPA